MSHPLRFALLAAAVMMAAAACKKDKTAAQANAEKIEAWKAQQKVRAVRSYQEILDNYPDSPFAAQARERIQAIGPVATPPPAKKK